ncbi:hypothetical protein NKH77_40595 [Streptomyces sp. M19]
MDGCPGPGGPTRRRHDGPAGRPCGGRPGRRLPAHGHHRHHPPVRVNGAAGLVNTVDGRLVSVMSFTVVDGRIAAIDNLSGPERLARFTA